VEESQEIARQGDTAQREVFVEQIQDLLRGAMYDEHLLVYVDEAHIHQDADLGYGWSVCGERLWVCSSSPGLSKKVSCYGLYIYNEGQVDIWSYPRANPCHYGCPRALDGRGPVLFPGSAHRGVV
jgi:hypothetical protein